MSTKKSRIKIILIVLLVVVSIPVVLMLSNKGAPVGWGWWGPVNADDGIAIHGYDPVAYFEGNKAEQGIQQHNHEWNGVTWHFSSQQNKSLFQEDPEKYAPEYGGYCATAVSAGITFDADPASWHIENNKLYLFYDNGAKQDWLSKLETGVITTGNSKWAARMN